MKILVIQAEARVVSAIKLTQGHRLCLKAHPLSWDGFKQFNLNIHEKKGVEDGVVCELEDVAIFGI